MFLPGRIQYIFVHCEWAELLDMTMLFTTAEFSYNYVLQNGQKQNLSYIQRTTFDRVS